MDTDASDAVLERAVELAKRSIAVLLVLEASVKVGLKLQEHERARLRNQSGTVAIATNPPKEHGVPLYLTSSFTLMMQPKVLPFSLGKLKEIYTVVLAIPTRMNLPARLQRLKALNLQWLRPVV